MKSIAIGTRFLSSVSKTSKDNKKSDSELLTDSKCYATQKISKNNEFKLCVIDVSDNEDSVNDKDKILYPQIRNFGPSFVDKTKLTVPSQTIYNGNFLVNQKIYNGDEKSKAGSNEEESFSEALDLETEEDDLFDISDNGWRMWDNSEIETIHKLNGNGKSYWDYNKDIDYEEPSTSECIVNGSTKKYGHQMARGKKNLLLFW